jgi:hypothetical protein
VNRLGQVLGVTAIVPLLAVCASLTLTEPPPECELPATTSPAADPSRDIVFVIDSSDSSGNQTGGDVDGDGKVNEGREDAWGRKVDDSVFALELQLVCALVRTLEPGSARVGLVTFSGVVGTTASDASIWLEPTSSYAEIRSALREIAETGPLGLTNLMEGVRTGADVLEDTRRRDGVLQVLVVVSAGEPTLPYYNPRLPRLRETRENSELAIGEAQMAADRGVMIHAYAIGPQAEMKPEPLPEIAMAAGGRFYRLSHPQDLKRILQASTWAHY